MSFRWATDLLGSLYLSQPWSHFPRVTWEVTVPPRPYPLSPGNIAPSCRQPGGVMQDPSACHLKVHTRAWGRQVGLACGLGPQGSRAHSLASEVLPEEASKVASASLIP